MAINIPSPAATPRHFNEIGHCVESVAAGGGETHILARLCLTFLIGEKMITAKEPVAASTKDITTGRIIIDPATKTISFGLGDKQEMTEIDYNYLFDETKGLLAIYKELYPDHIDVKIKTWEELSSVEVLPI